MQTAQAQLAAVSRLRLECARRHRLLLQLRCPGQLRVFWQLLCMGASEGQVVRALTWGLLLCVAGPKVGPLAQQQQQQQPLLRQETCRWQVQCLGGAGVLCRL